MADPSDVERDLQTLAAELRRLEGEYTMFFAGRLPRPPWETRTRVETILKRYERGQLIEQASQRFRLSTLQARFATFADLWDRGLRAREEGRPGPFSQRPRAPVGRDVDEAPPRVLHVTSFTDPAREVEKLDELFVAVMDARRDAGEDVVAFHRFAELVRDEVRHLREDGAQEVALRLSVQGGKVKLTARALRGGAGADGREGGEVL